MNEPKLCPMMFAESRVMRDQRSAENPWMPYCVQARCAWWDERTEHCAILGIDRYQESISEMAI